MQKLKFRRVSGTSSGNSKGKVKEITYYNKVKVFSFKSSLFNFLSYYTEIQILSNTRRGFLCDRAFVIRLSKLFTILRL